MSRVESSPRFTAVADHAVLVDFASGDGRERDEEAEQTANDAVVALDHALSSASITGVREVVPALVNLLVEFDPSTTDHETVESGIRLVLAGATERTHDPTAHRVPVCYDPAVSPDLDAVAGVCDLSVEAVIAAHLAGDYRVLMYGFAPGYAYLGGLPATIHLPRKPAPVRGVAAGSVIIAGPQCLITTITMPTGWSIIGASPARVIADDPDRPFLFEPGDEVTFERIDLATLEARRSAT